MNTKRVAAAMIHVSSRKEGFAWVKNFISLEEIQTKIRLAHVFQETKQFKKSDSLYYEVIKTCRTDKEAASLLHFALQHAGKNEFDQGKLLRALQYFEEALSFRLRGSAPLDQVESTKTAIARTKEQIAQENS